MSLKDSPSNDHITEKIKYSARGACQDITEVEAERIEKIRRIEEHKRSFRPLAQSIQRLESEASFLESFRGKEVKRKDGSTSSFYASKKYDGIPGAFQEGGSLERNDEGYWLQGSKSNTKTDLMKNWDEYDTWQKKPSFHVKAQLVQDDERRIQSRQSKGTIVSAIPILERDSQSKETLRAYYSIIAFGTFILFLIIFVFGIIFHLFLDTAKQHTSGSDLSKQTGKLDFSIPTVKPSFEPTFLTAHIPSSFPELTIEVPFQEISIFGMNLNLQTRAELNLAGSDLSGTIPTEIGLLTNLVSLNLWNNNLTGAIPTEIGELTKITHLDLHENNLSELIPGQLSYLTKLEYLSLFENNFFGEIPLRIQNLRELELLDFHGNRLTGSISTGIGGLKKLTCLKFHQNKLTGTIPAEFSNLTDLRWLSIHQNKLSGNTPSEIGKLKHLEWMSLSNNMLVGSIPLEISSLIKIESLSLSSNNLTGPLPTELGRLTKLTYLSLHQNNFTGRIPIEFGFMTKLSELSMCENSLEGTIPTQLGALQYLREVTFHENALSGSIPTEIGNMNNLEHLDLSNNKLWGTIPVELGRLRKIKQLLLHRNLLFGYLPPSLAELTNLYTIWLSENDIRGEIPTVMCLKVTPRIDCDKVHCDCCVNSLGMMCTPT